MAIPDSFRLDGKVLLITGASSGLGAAFAQAVAEAGADVVLVARRADRLGEVAERIRAIGGRAITVPADLRCVEHCDAAVARAMDAFGEVNALVNNAGIATVAPATREKPDDFRRVIELNLNGSYWMAQACGRVMQPGSSIVNISSVLALTTAGLPQAAYSASKAALVGLTRDLAVQWGGRKGIRVNALAPGYFPSEMTEVQTAEYRQSLHRRIVLGRYGYPEELAATLVWLVSPGGGYVTGQTIVVDGGFSIN